MSDSKGGAGGMGMNMVTTVMAFSVSAFFVLFVFTRLLCARLHLSRAAAAPDVDLHQRLCSSSAASSPSLSIWRRKKEMGKEGLMAVAQLKRLAALPPAGGHPRLEQFMCSHVSRLLRTDLLAVLAELLRQDHVSLSMKV